MWSSRSGDGILVHIKRLNGEEIESLNQFKEIILFLKNMKNNLKWHILQNVQLTNIVTGVMLNLKPF